tara:strand:- start:44166 stop:44588 length:423 start_codon:yes stop_codon:yes gene_type:complete
MFSHSRENIRRFYRETWQKYLKNIPLEGLELLVSQVIKEHPEYQEKLVTEDINDYNVEAGESNPFLHMGMHITLAEQLGSDRPAGIRLLHQKMSLREGNAHEAEHKMMECLGLILWEAQRNGETPDEDKYLECMKKLVSN